MLKNFFKQKIIKKTANFKFNDTFSYNRLATPKKKKKGCEELGFSMTFDVNSWC